LSVAGGCAPYGYLWSNGATTEDVSGLGAGTYVVTVTDANGCTSTNSFTLTEPVLLATSGIPATFSCGYNVSCNGATNGSINLSVAGGCAPYGFAWSSGASTEDVSVLGAGTYGVTVTDANGCTTTNSFTLTEPVPVTTVLTPTVFAGGFNLSCNGANDGAIDLTSAGGCAPYTYSWSNGDTLEDPSGLSAGWQMVTVSDANGCSAIDSVLLLAPDTLVATITPFVFNGGWNISCNGLSDGFVNLEVIGGSGTYSYAWSNGNSNQDLQFVPAGTYLVTITDANGCTLLDSITLNEPEPIALAIVPSVYGGGYNISCYGASDGAVDLTVSGGTPGYAFAWSNFSFSEDLVNVQAGTYLVLVTDANACTMADTITLTEPQPWVTNAVATPTTCTGGASGAIDLTVSGSVPPYSYLWSNGATTEDLSALGPQEPIPSR
jgi:hypothetical protein